MWIWLACQPVVIPVDTGSPVTDTGLPADTDDTDLAAESALNPAPGQTLCALLSFVPLDGDIVPALVTVDVGTGEWEERARWPGTVMASSSMQTSGLVFFDGAWLFSLFTGDTGNHWVRAAPDGGALQVGISSNEAGITTDGDGLVVSSGGVVTRFASADDLLTGQNGVTIGASIESRIAFGDGRFVSTVHSASSATVRDPAFANPVTVPLEDWDTWIWGISVLPGRFFLVDDGRRGDTPGAPLVGTFDLLGGRRLGSVEFDLPDHGHPSGLWCESGG